MVTCTLYRPGERGRAVIQALSRERSLRREVLDLPTLIPELYKTGQLPRTPVKLVVLTQVAIRLAPELAESE